MKEEAPPPFVKCTSCGREVQCIRVQDGTVYRPLAWSFEDPSKPLEGKCVLCSRSFRIS